jgi:SAM-dependent methyltransferase
MEIALDRWLEIETRVEVEAEALGYRNTTDQPYAASSWLTLPLALGLKPRPDDVFVDLGAGKGRMVLQAAIFYRFRRVVGVERDPSLAELAMSHVRRNRHRFPASNVDVITDDISRFHLPDDASVVYLFNSVLDSAFAALLVNLLDLADRRDKPVTFIYYNPFEHPQVMATGRATVRLTRRYDRVLATAPLHVYELHPSGVDGT